MNGLDINTSQTPSLPYWKTPKLPFAAQATKPTRNSSLFWCIAKNAIQTQPMNPKATLHIQPEITRLHSTNKASIVSVCEVCPPHHTIYLFTWKQSLLKRPVIPEINKWGGNEMRDSIYGSPINRSPWCQPSLCDRNNMVWLSWHAKYPNSLQMYLWVICFEINCTWKQISHRVMFAYRCRSEI